MTTAITEEDERRQAASDEVRRRFSPLVRERIRLRAAGFEPTGVLLPRRLNVPYTGPGATDFNGSCMGMPITWSDTEQWGLILALPEPSGRA